ncbi:MAG: hypothetical protein ACYST5_04330 [Planctomycetota bacterium]
MLKKTMLSIIATIVLIGAANLIAQERKDRPEARARQRQKGWAEQPRRQRAGREAVREHTEQVQQQRATQEARRKRTENLRGKPQPVRPGQNQAGFPQGGIPAQPRQMFGGCLDELTKAYRANDREKMGQLLRKMHQLRQEWQEIRGRGFKGRGIGRSGRGWQGRDIGRKGQSFQGRGMTGEWGRGFQGRDIGGWGRGWQGRDIGRRGQSLQDRGMAGGWGRGFQGRGIGRSGPGMPPPPVMEKPEPPEDVDRPNPPMPRRGMGRRGRGSPEQ